MGGSRRGALPRGIASQRILLCSKGPFGVGGALRLVGALQ